MPFVSGFLRVRGAGHPDQGLPDVEEPVDPGYGLDVGEGTPVVPGHLPAPPPGVWPPITPSHPIQPAPPDTPPGAIWPPPMAPTHPIQPTPPDSGSPTPPIATPPDSPSHPISGVPGKFWVVAGIPGVGWRYVCVDPSLVAGMPLPPMPEPKS